MQATYTTAPGQAVTVRSRVVDANGSALQPQFVQCWSLEVHPQGDADPTPLLQSVPGGGAVVLSALSTVGWDADATGYNFRHTIPGTAFPDGGREYAVTYTLQMTTGSPVLVCARVQASSC